MRILLADEQAKVRFALRVLLEQQPGLEVMGEAVDGQGLLALVDAVSPDVVLVDWKLPGLSGGQLLASLQNGNPDLAIIVLSPRMEARQAALDAGAAAFVCKCDAPQQLLAAISRIRSTRTGSAEPAGAGRA